MISKAQMKNAAFEAQAEGLETKAAGLKLTPAMGPNATQRDVNRLRSFLLAEAGKLRAKRLALEDAEKHKKLKRLQSEGNEVST